MPAPLLTAAAFCQWPLPEPEAPTYHVCHVEAIEVNTYYDYAGNEATQLLFWEQDRRDTKGKRWGVYKGYARYDGTGLTFEDNQFVYRGNGSDYDVIEMRANQIFHSHGYDAHQTMLNHWPVLRFEIQFRWWN